jgi:hypothetical protein
MGRTPAFSTGGAVRKRVPGAAASLVTVFVSLMDFPSRATDHESLPQSAYIVSET